LDESVDLRGEMQRARDSLAEAAAETQDVVEARMRSIVKRLLALRYAAPVESIEEEQTRTENRQAFERGGQLGDRILGVDTSSSRQKYMDSLDWGHDRPKRVQEYVQKIADIFPATHLTSLLRSSEEYTAEELIEFYEAVKGEAKRSDYSGQPSGIDPSMILVKARIVHARRNSKSDSLS
jgi:hypothetical protein